MQRLPSLLLLAALLLAGCTDADDPDPGVASPSPGDPTTAPATPSPTPSPTPPPLPPLQGLALELVADGFSEPILAVSPPDDDRIFVAGRTGVVWIIDANGTVHDEPFLDLRGTVHANSIEQGLLGLAFHPEYAENGRLFVYHSLPDNDNQLVEYRVSADDPGLGAPESARVMRVFDKEPDKVRHNAGHLLFGPDGYLWVSVGDAARASVNGQDPNTPFGAIHRYDVDADDGQDWTPAADNPFVEGGGDPAIWAYGLRNPWRFSIDVPTETIWIGDVGQETWEEINTVPVTARGTNFGWPVLEGTDTFYGGEPGGPTTQLTDPFAVVRHDEAEGGCSITGGWVYRGEAIPELDGDYFFADWCLGWIRSIDTTDDTRAVTDHSEALPVQMPSSFGIDPDGELLVVDYATGSVHRVVAVR
ncbi:MAG: PQQ-dependent sugar dehydrogenase [Nitriliruptorales bacterium]|nr:PQQ-dependent sugar dehydrogenase [Nitriliruptorales bacterium]